MEAILGRGGNNPNGGDEPQTDEPLPDEPRDIPPEEMPVQDRWYTWADGDATATVTHSVADDGLCTIVVGGTEHPDWNRWKATANYSYTVKANTVYEYKFEAWTAGGNRNLDIAYYNEYDGDGTVLQFLNFEINSTPTIYTMIGGEIPKDRIASLEFHCADQLGKFSVKILSITPSRNDFGVANLTQWNAAVSEINSNDAGVYIIDIVAGFSMNGVTDNTVNTFSASYIDVTINGGNHAITLSGTGSLLRIGGYQTVTIRDLTLRGDIGNNASLVYIGGGTFNMESGIITGNINEDEEGGGVNIVNGTFTMTGGTVSNNTAGAGGGGVYVRGAFTMSGTAKISSNDSSYGGGVYVHPGGTFKMQDSASVSGNTAGNRGGGVFVDSGGTFTMESGAVTDNEASSGGGVYVDGGTFAMKGGSVFGNEVEKFGGGVYIGSGSTFNMSDGSVFGNNGGLGGGGVCVGGDGTFTMNGGTVSGNNTGSVGGGVYVDSDGTFTMSGSAEVSGNTASSNGGGVYVDGGEFTMNGGTISGNTASYGGSNIAANGGGVYLNGSDSTFTMNGGTVSGNTAIGTYSNGGGVVVDSATFRIVTGTVYGTGEGTLSNTIPNNTTASSAALFANTGTAQHGTFSGTGGAWVSAGNLITRNETIDVVDGVIAP